MQHLITFIFVLTVFICASYAAPVDNKDANKDSKSAFGQAFDEIVVESHLTVRRKNNARQGRTQNATSEAPTAVLKTKREIRRPMHNPQTVLRQPLVPKQSGSASSAQSQAVNSYGPLGSFGSSAASTQSQSFGVGPNGLIGSAGFSGTQQYNFNGQTIDIAFGSGFSSDGKSNGSGAAITITGPDGKKRPLNG